MIYTPEILTGIDVNINRLQKRLDSDLSWGANVHIFGRIYENRKKGNNIFEAYAGTGEYVEIFIDDKKTSTIAFLVDKKRELPSNEVIVTVIVSVYLPDAYTGTFQHDEHALIDIVRLLRNSGLIKVDTISTDFYEIFSSFDINRIEYRNMYPFTNFSVRGTMRFIEKCLT